MGLVVLLHYIDAHPATMDPDDLCAHGLWNYMGAEVYKWGPTVAAYAAAAALALVALVPGPVTWEGFAFTDLSYIALHVASAEEEFGGPGSGKVRFFV